MDEHRGSERRAHPRVATDSRVDILFEDHTSDANATCMNISEGGLFVAASELFEEGTRLGVGVRPSESQPPVRGTAEVVWLRPDASNGLPRGMGLRWIDLDESARTTLESLCRTEETATAAAGEENPEQASPTELEEEVAGLQQPLDFFAGDEPEEGVSPSVVGDEPAEEVAPVTLSSPEVGREPFTLTFEDDGDEFVAEGGSPVLRQLLLALVGLVIVVGVLWVLWPRSEPRPTSEVPASMAATSRPASQPVTPVAVPSDAGPTAVGEGASLEPDPDLPPQDLPAVPPAVVLGGASRVTNISWREDGGIEEIRIRGNGDLARQQVAVTLLSGPARCLVRLIGIEEPFYRSRLRVGMAQVRGLRIGWHSDEDPRELHVVLDLASIAVAVDSRVEGDTLVVSVRPD